MDVVARRKQKGLWELMNSGSGEVAATVRQLVEVERLPSLNLVPMAVKLIPLDNGKYAAVPENKVYGTKAVAVLGRPDEIHTIGHLSAGEGAFERIGLELQYEQLVRQLETGSGDFYATCRKMAEISLKIARRDGLLGKKRR